MATPTPLDLEAEIHQLEATHQEVENFITPGTNHLSALAPLLIFAGSTTRGVVFEPIRTRTGLIGITECDKTGCIIRVDRTIPANSQVCVLFHELAHVWMWEKKLPVDGEMESEAFAEAVAYLAAQEIGLDTHLESLSYLAKYAPAPVRLQIWATYLPTIRAWAHRLALATRA